MKSLLRVEFVHGRRIIFDYAKDWESVTSKIFTKCYVKRNIQFRRDVVNLGILKCNNTIVVTRKYCHYKGAFPLKRD